MCFSRGSRANVLRIMFRCGISSIFGVYLVTCGFPGCRHSESECGRIRFILACNRQNLEVVGFLRVRVLVLWLFDDGAVDIWLKGM